MNDRHICSGVQKNPRTRFPESPPGEVWDSTGSPEASLGTCDVSSVFIRPGTLGACQGLVKQTQLPSWCHSWKFLVGRKMLRIKHVGTHICSLRNPCLSAGTPAVGHACRQALLRTVAAGHVNSGQWVWTSPVAALWPTVW